MTVEASYLNHSCCFRISCRRNRKQLLLPLPMEHCLSPLPLVTETGELQRYQIEVYNGK